MKEIQAITICNNCKKVFNGVDASDYTCPDCKSNDITLVSKEGIIDAVEMSVMGEGCPHMFDGYCGLTGDNIFGEE